MTDPRRSKFTFDRTMSNAEQDLLKELHGRGLHPLTKQPIILRYTVPDFCFPLKAPLNGPVKFLCIYLDGVDVHDLDEDLRVKQELEEKGHKVLRIPYKAPANPKTIAMFGDQIEAAYREAFGDSVR